MIIGIDASRANRAQKTGVEWYSYHLIQELKKIIPRDAEVILYSDDKLKGDLGNLPENWKEKIIKSPIQNPITKKGWLWTQLRLSLEMVFSRPDILFVPSHAIPLIHPKHTITTIHDIGFLRYPESYKTLGRIYHKFSSYFASKFAYKIIVPSEFTKGELMEIYKIPHWKIHVTHLGFNEIKYNLKNTGDEEVKSVLRSYQIKKPYFLFVGRLEEKKNILNLIKAFDLFIKKTGLNHQLVLAGMPGFGFLKFEELIKKLNLKDRVIITGFVKDENIPILYKNSKALILPSYYEGFGIPILEAFACGVPVIGSRSASIPEVANDSAILIDPKNVKELSHALQVVLNDLTRKVLIEKGLKRVREFSWERMAQKTWEIINLKN